MLLFQYALKPVRECLFPLNSTGQKNVAWFWLTDSAYCIDLGDIRLFQVSFAWQKKYGKIENTPGWDEYQYIRQLEDLFDILPEIATPVPDWAWKLINTPEKRLAFKAQVDNWYDKQNDPSDEEWDLYADMSRIAWDNNRLDTGYLCFRSLCWFCRVKDRLVIQYDFRDNDEENDPVWSASVGMHEMSYTRFIQELENLVHRFFLDMESQVENAIAELTGKDYVFYAVLNDDKKTNPAKTGHDHLRAEHIERKTFFMQRLETAKKEKNAINWPRLKLQYERWLVLSRTSSPAP